MCGIWMSNVLRGSRLHNAKLSEDLVKDIKCRLATGEPRMALAREFRVTRSAIRSIANGITWKHVQPPAIGQQ